MPSLLTSWNFEPLQVIPTLLIGLLYARRVRTLREAGTPVAAWRLWCFGSSLFLVLVALVSPIDAFGEEQFLFMHMVQHILLGDLAPLLFVLGLTGPILRPVLSLPGVLRLRFLLHPLVALPLWAASLYIWHIPFLYQAALHHSAVHALEHFCFFAFGAVMWAPVVEVLPGSRMVRHGREARLRPPLSGWSRRSSGTSSSGRGKVFYPFYEHPVNQWGISALSDQQIAGGGDDGRGVDRHARGAGVALPQDGCRRASCASGLSNRDWTSAPSSARSDTGAQACSKPSDLQPDRHEPTTSKPWNERLARFAIRDIVDEVVAAGAPEDGEFAAGVYEGAAGELMPSEPSVAMSTGRSEQGKVPE